VTMCCTINLPSIAYMSHRRIDRDARVLDAHSTIAEEFFCLTAGYGDGIRQGHKVVDLVEPTK
jgi:hypothetical protein